ncbi:MAG: tRNA glutamyl-Q(34) synthetase GluQRS [Natronospirillum sp.]|uniref:tRNA glutamyl-Q(34) synthetase GluQRS n=1 Tax=Natronospirillum sp. TaxID=2812955 RepID=UPI0025D4862E|nr:tRNA glutamyl-Q(34) synthetase GluQRS [Natronospirillum sp.]MCH8550685.1 tRNA glutamyl-Q(34) synthetase GluQRS [Natronospirillum sp.]
MNRPAPESRPRYRGRFAPSPSGPLHLGSLVAALGSWLDARAAGGEWLLRMEDIDPPREQPGAAQDILRTLEAYGLHWDGPVTWQSERSAAYAAALQTLQPLLFWCTCTRAELRAAKGVYPGTCHARRAPPDEKHAAVRLRTPEPLPGFRDRMQGDLTLAAKDTGTDPILRRKDGLWAYQLAVVVDDGAQGITHVVRGNDLLNTTPLQVALQQCLGLPTPDYLHLPVIQDQQGRKLSKQNHAPAIRARDSDRLLRAALLALGLTPPADLLPTELLPWGTEHWVNRQHRLHSVQPSELSGADV